jgi:hypothetical protein
MDPKILTEKAWKDALIKLKLKDNGLQRALGDYEKLDDSDFEERAKCLSRIAQLVTAVKKSKEAAGNREADKYLTNLAGAATFFTTQVRQSKTKADAEAEKSKAEEAKDAESAKPGSGGEETAEYGPKLLASLQRLKSSKDVAFEFLICEAKPFYGLAVARKISPQNKAELTKVTGGTHFLPVGTCVFEDGKFDFRLDKPVPGLARKISDCIKNFTGKKFPVKAGLESEADGDTQAPAGAAAPQEVASGQAETAKPAASAPRGRVTLEQAPQHWHSTRGDIDGIIKNLKQAVLGEFSGAGQELIAELDKTMSKLDVILDKLDQRLADSLDKAGAAKDPASRQAELKNSKTILAQYITYVKSEPLIQHIDDNPLGVPANLRQTLTERLTQMAQAIG